MEGKIATYYTKVTKASYKVTTVTTMSHQVPPHSPLRN